MYADKRDRHKVPYFKYLAARIRLLSCCGWILAVMEVYKQLFIFRIVSGGIYDWWFFPFQLCSVPMYMCILLPFTSERSSLRAAMLTFMTGYTFISAAAALIYPEDYLRSYVTLTAHGFVWHGILLFISLTIGLSCMSDLSRRGILRSVSLYLLLSAAAIGINMYADRAMRSAHASGYAAMFYLNPYHISPQPVVGAIQDQIAKSSADGKNVDLSPVINTVFDGLKPRVSNADVAVVLDLEPIKANAALFMPLLGGVETKSQQEMESDTIDWSLGENAGTDDENADVDEDDLFDDDADVDADDGEVEDSADEQDSEEEEDEEDDPFA